MTDANSCEENVYNVWSSVCVNAPTRDKRIDVVTILFIIVNMYILRRLCAKTILKITLLSYHGVLLKLFIIKCRILKVKR